MKAPLRFAVAAAALLSLCIDVCRCDTHIDLRQHTLEAPFTYDAKIANWMLAGATIPGRQHVVLAPKVANRTGYLWHKDPIHTSLFEVEFEFQVSSPEFSKSEGFAFWYAAEDFKKVFDPSPNSTQSQQWKLFGYKPDFQGLGIFFSNFDRNSRSRPSISAVVGDGKRSYLPVKDIPTESTHAHNVLFMDFKNSNAPIKFRLTADLEAVHGELQLAGGAPWVNVFRLQGQRLQSGGYIGFSAYTGPEAGSVRKEGDRTVIKSLRTFNLDASATGEEDVNHQADMGDGVFDGEDFLKEHSQHKEEREFQEAMRQLTRMLYKHVSEQAPREQVIHKTLTSLQNQIQKLTTDLAELSKQMRDQGGSKAHEQVAALKKELSGLKQIFAKDTQTHSATLSSLHKSVAGLATAEENSKHVEEMRQLTQKAQLLELTVKKQNSTATYLVFGVVVAVMVAAFVVYKKQKELEKKHYF